MAKTQVQVFTKELPSYSKIDNQDHSPLYDVAADAKRVFEVLRKGGLAIIPSDVGYGIVATDTTALERAFQTKQRKPHKRHAMIGNWNLHKEIHNISGSQADMIEVLVKVNNVPLGIVAPYNANHPLVQKLGPETLKRSSVENTMAMLVNGGAFQDEITRLTSEAGLPLMGSSANLTGKGTKTLVTDIEPEILAAADIIIDHGPRKYSFPRASSTMIDFRKPALLRFGACYDVIKDTLKRYYDIDFPEDPGKSTLFSGHIQELKKLLTISLDNKAIVDSLSEDYVTGISNQLWRYSTMVKVMCHRTNEDENAYECRVAFWINGTIQNPEVCKELDGKYRQLSDLEGKGYEYVEQNSLQPFEEPDLNAKKASHFHDVNPNPAAKLYPLGIHSSFDWDSTSIYGYQLKRN